MNEDYVKEVFSRIDSGTDKKVPFSVSIKEGLKARLLDLCGGSSPSPVVEKLIEDFVVKAEEMKSRAK